MSSDGYESGSSWILSIAVTNCTPDNRDFVLQRGHTDGCSASTFATREWVSFLSRLKLAGLALLIGIAREAKPALMRSTISSSTLANSVGRNAGAPKHSSPTRRIAPTNNRFQRVMHRTG